MKKKLLTLCGILAFICFLGILQYLAEIRGDNGVLDVAYDRMNTNKYKTELEIITRTDYDDKRLFWITKPGDEEEGLKYYYYFFKIIGDEKYEYYDSGRSGERVPDCAHGYMMVYRDGIYPFLVNNPECAYIRIEETTGFTDIPVESIPFSYVYEISDEFVDFYFLFEDKTSMQR